MNDASRRAILAALFVCACVRGASAQINTAGDRNVHDPSRVLKVDDRYYTFYTGNSTNRIRSRSSSDLVNWTAGANVFTTAPAWTTTAVPGAGNFWAPDVVYVDGEYHMYYSVSTFGSQRSAIGLATSPTLNPTAPNYQWTDRGPVLQSQQGSQYNAIDAGILLDDNGKMFMTFGSFWGGIYVTELDRLTGMRITPSSPVYRLAQNVPTTAIEAAYLHQRGATDYFLFVNWGTCCQGTSSTYNIRVGRGASPIGPFFDKNGVNMVNGGGTLFLGTEGSVIGPGHLSIFEEDDEEIFTYHYYDGTSGGTSRLNWRTLAWDPQGWPVIADTLDAADFNADGVVNATDLATWKAGFAAGDKQGDADGDGDTDGNDFVLWQRRLGTIGATAAAEAGLAAAPEPAGAVLILAAAAALSRVRSGRACRKWRRP